MRRHLHPRLWPGDRDVPGVATSSAPHGGGVGRGMLAGALVGLAVLGAIVAPPAMAADDSDIVWTRNSDGTYSGVWSPWATEPEPLRLPQETRGDLGGSAAARGVSSGAGGGMGSSGGGGGGGGDRGLPGSAGGTLAQSGEWTVGPWVAPSGRRGCVTFSTGELRSRDSMALAQVGDNRLMLLKSPVFERMTGPFHATVRIDQGFSREMTFAIDRGIAFAELTQVRPLIDAFRQGLVLTLHQNGREQARFSLIGSSNSVDLLRTCIQRAQRAGW